MKTTNPTHFLLGDLARLLDCKPHQITYLLTSRQVPEPALRIGGRRMFTAEDVERVRAALKTNERQL
jgi:DNA-binding transcriptional MerR regulator